ncbi:hypothetical protein MKX01_000061 [Papaver californicum]|nr:hypothetical protein MKX01_000061 [Papaver californicum]
MDCIMENQTPISTEEPSSSAEVRNWVELPPDVLSHIFLKLGVIDILFRAQSVCSMWRKVSKEPLLFRSIDMWNRWDLEVVDRSCGKLVEYSMEHFGSDELLAYIADKSGSLRCLRLVSCYRVSDDALINVAKKAVMLEELAICQCSFSEDMLKTVGKACPQLNSFRLNCRGFRRPRIECDEEALAIAENMPDSLSCAIFICFKISFGLGLTYFLLRFVILYTVELDQMKGVFVLFILWQIWQKNCIIFWAGDPHPPDSTRHMGGSDPTRPEDQAGWVRVKKF